MSYDIQLRNLNIPNTFTKDTDIRDILSDIQTNFEILKHSSLWKGEKGDSLTPKIVNLDALVDSTITNEAPFNTTDALKTLYLKIVQPIVDQSSDQVSFGDRRLLWVLDYLNPATTPSMKENIKNSHRQFMPGNIVLMVDENNKVFYSNHYVFVDPRFRNNLVTPPNNQQDLSCALLASPEGADYKFTAYNAFPQVAYNRTTNTYTWKMNGVVTAIPVMGQKGEPGKSVNNQFVIVTRKEGASGDIFKISHIGTRNLYISGDTKVDNYAEIIKEYINKPAFILPGLDFDPTKKGNNLWVGSTALSSDGKDLIVYCSEDNRLDLGTNVKNLFSVMMDMGAYKNYPINDGSTPARGIIFPMYRNNEERDGNKYFMMYTSPKLTDGGDFGNSLNQLKKQHKNIHTVYLEPFKDTEDLKLNRPGINPTTDDYYGFDVHGLMRTQLLVASGAIPVISESYHYKDWSNPGNDYESEDSKRVHIQANDGGIFGLCGVFGDNDMRSYYGTGAKISGKLEVSGGFDNYGAINTYPLPSDHDLGPNVSRKGGVVVYDDQYRKKTGLLTGDGEVTYKIPVFVEDENNNYLPVTKKFYDTSTNKVVETAGDNRELIYCTPSTNNDFVLKRSYTKKPYPDATGCTTTAFVNYLVSKNGFEIQVDISLQVYISITDPQAFKNAPWEVKFEDILTNICNSISNELNSIGIQLPNKISSNVDILYHSFDSSPSNFFYNGKSIFKVNNININDRAFSFNYEASTQVKPQGNMGIAFKYRFIDPSINIDKTIGIKGKDKYIYLKVPLVEDAGDGLVFPVYFDNDFGWGKSIRLNVSEEDADVMFEFFKTNKTPIQLFGGHQAYVDHILNFNRLNDEDYNIIKVNAESTTKDNIGNVNFKGELVKDNRKIYYVKNLVQNDLGEFDIWTADEFRNSPDPNFPIKIKATVVERFNPPGKNYPGYFALFNMERLN